MNLDVKRDSIRNRTETEVCTSVGLRPYPGHQIPPPLGGWTVASPSCNGFPNRGRVAPGVRASVRYSPTKVAAWQYPNEGVAPDPTHVVEA